MSSCPRLWSKGNPLVGTLPSLEAARKRLERVPGGTDLIDAETYRQGRTNHISDLLRWSPGVWVQPRFGADEARLSIRGSGLQRTIGLRGIKLLQDGIPIDHADGSAFFHAFDPLATRYIEVYRGANALQYGATTLGGAINFVSPSGYDAPPVSVRIEGGSFDYKQARLALAGVRGASDGFLSATYADQEGFRRLTLRRGNTKQKRRGVMTSKPFIIRGCQIITFTNL